ncbi:MAG: lytic transglycosylase [Nitrosomonadales bacterium]|nr:lytic transglycosylase [Nitrosomonadales bacterium]|tara:strand:- start:616 stop:1932 length:1317 start_codon:yes stop_codon:yes gene_type:complete
MNFEINRLLKILSIIILYSLTLNIHAETNALGQQITVINPEKTKKTKLSEDLSIWSRINSGYKMKQKPSRRIRNFEKWYSKRPEYVERMLERSEKYLFYVTNEVQKRNMPMEIALLPMIESAYNPVATSRKKAAGMWQFIPSTGRIYGLKQNWWIDDRRNVIESTNAALNYLEKLYKDFGTWELALASYNAGEGRISRAIKRNKKNKRSRDYYNLRIPRETKNYVPKLFAIKNIISNPKKYGFTLPEIKNKSYFETVTVKKNIDTQLIARLAEISIEEFQLLNPQYKRPVINVTNMAEKINLPYQNIHIFNYNFHGYNKPLSNWTPYKPKRKESVAQVAKKFGIDRKILIQVNRLERRKSFRRNSTILIPNKDAITTYFPTNINELYNYSSIITHKIKSGETLSHISDKYNISVRDIKEFNELRSDKIIIGDILDIPK